MISVPPWFSRFKCYLFISKIFLEKRFAQKLPDEYFSLGDLQLLLFLAFSRVYLILDYAFIRLIRVLVAVYVSINAKWLCAWLPDFSRYKIPKREIVSK
jgi:hypothetical protein